jgi:hypothetical protein
MKVKSIFHAILKESAVWKNFAVNNFVLFSFAVVAYNG